jgi:hypothetical protein
MVRASVAIILCVRFLWYNSEELKLQNSEHAYLLWVIGCNTIYQHSKYDQDIAILI